MIAIITGAFLFLICRIILFKGLADMIGGQKGDG